MRKHFVDVKYPLCKHQNLHAWRTENNSEKEIEAATESMAWGRDIRTLTEFGVEGLLWLVS